MRRHTLPTANYDEETDKQEAQNLWRTILNTAVVVAGFATAIVIVAAYYVFTHLPT